MNLITRWRLLLFICCWSWLIPTSLEAIPLKSPILDASGNAVASLLVDVDYVEIYDSNKELIGKIGSINIQGRTELFLIQDNQKQTLVGVASGKTLYHPNGESIASYDWDAFWARIYDPKGIFLGKIKCIAFRGLCAAAAAGYLTGVLAPITALPIPPSP